MITKQNEKQEHRMPDQHIMRICGDKNMTDCGQGHDDRYEASENKVTWCTQKSRSGEIRT